MVELLSFTSTKPFCGWTARAAFDGRGRHCAEQNAGQAGQLRRQEMARHRRRGGFIRSGAPAQTAGVASGGKRCGAWGAA